MCAYTRRMRADDYTTAIHHCYTSLLYITACCPHQAKAAAAAEHEGALTELLRELESTQQRAAVAAREAAQHSALAAQLEAQLIEAGKQAQAAAQEATDAGRQCAAVQKRADAQVSA
jgi:hypothetical protein